MSGKRELSKEEKRRLKAERRANETPEERAARKAKKKAKKKAEEEAARQKAAKEEAAARRRAEEAAARERAQQGKGTRDSGGKTAGVGREAELEDYGDYEEDDFETYDEDDFETFEEETAGGVSAGAGMGLLDEATRNALIATQAENARLSSQAANAQARRAEAAEAEARAREQQSNFVKERRFVAPKVKNKREAEAISHKQRQRAKDLLSMLELDTVAFEMFDMAPETEYEVYMKSYGSLNSAQVAVQSVETEERGAQSEKVVYANKSVQMPEEGFGAASKRRLLERRDEVGFEDTGRLNAFIVGAGEVMDTLLADRAARRRRREEDDVAGDAEGERLGGLGAGAVSAVALDEGETRMAAVYAGSGGNKMGVGWTKTGGVGVWNLKTLRLEGVLRTHVEVRCVAFATSWLVVCGSESGGVLVYDLREAGAEHGEEGGVVVRSPTYCSDAVFGEAHRAGIVQVRVVDGREQQVVSLDEEGVVNLWLLMDRQEGDVSQDLGLRVGGRVRLVHSTRVEVMVDSLMGVRDVCVSGRDRNLVSVCTDMGSVVKRACFGDTAPPLAYTCSGEEGEATCASVCPHMPGMFLVGYTSGQVCLFDEEVEWPVTMFNAWRGEEVRGIGWVRDKPGVFVVLEGEWVSVWSVLRSDQVPVDTVSLGEAGRSVGVGGGVVCVGLEAGDVVVRDVGHVSSGSVEELEAWRMAVVE